MNFDPTRVPGRLSPPNRRVQGQPQHPFPLAAPKRKMSLGTKTLLGIAIGVNAVMGCLMVIIILGLVAFLLVGICVGTIYLSNRPT
jgi:hypothetical protein